MAFESRKLNRVEQRYSMHERNMTIVILGGIFTVVTDNVAKYLLQNLEEV